MFGELKVRLEEFHAAIFVRNLTYVIYNIVAWRTGWRCAVLWVQEQLGYDARAHWTERDVP